MWRKVSIACIVFLLLGGAAVYANEKKPNSDPLPGQHPAQRQVQHITAQLVDSEAEHVMGSYLPEMGAVFTLDLVRVPNTAVGKSPVTAVRDWAIYLMQSIIAPQIDAVPAAEPLFLSISFFDYDFATYRQLVLRVPANVAADPTQYHFWLDGTPYAA